MSSTPTTRNRFNKQGTGDNSGTWGATLNTQDFDLIDESLDGLDTIAVNANVTLSSTNYATDQSRKRIQKFTGTGGFTVTIPGVEKWYLVHNAASAAITVKTAAGTSVSVAAGQITFLYCDGTDCFLQTTAALTGVTSINGGAGFCIDRTYTYSDTYQAFSSAIPLDDSLPQSSEGSALLSLTHTPKSTTNRIRITVSIPMVTANAPLTIIAPLFRNAGASAVAVGTATIDTAGYHRNIHYVYEITPGVTSLETYAVRIGPSSGTGYINGNSSGRLLGGALIATLVVEEFET